MFCLLLPETSPALMPPLHHIQPSGLLAGWSLVLLCQQKSSPPLLSGVSEYHPHDKSVSQFCSPCHLQESIPQRPATSDFFQVISPGSRPSCFNWVNCWHSPRVTTSPRRCLWKVSPAEVVCQVTREETGQLLAILIPPLTPQNRHGCFSWQQSETGKKKGSWKRFAALKKMS